MSGNDNEIEINNYLSAIECHFKQFIIKKIDLNQLKANNDWILSQPYHTKHYIWGFIVSQSVYSEDFKSRINYNFDDFTKNSNKYLKFFSNN